MRARTFASMLVGVVLGLAVFYVWNRFFPDGLFQLEERPPIIVQENSIEYQIDPTKTTKWKEKHAGKYRKFRLDHSGKDVKAFTVATSAASSCNGVDGTFAQIDFNESGTVRKFWLYIEDEGAGNKSEPVTDAEVDLTKGSGDQVVSYGTAGSGYISGLTILGVGNPVTCAFASGDKPKLTFTFK